MSITQILNKKMNARQQTSTHTRETAILADKDKKGAFARAETIKLTNYDFLSP